MHPILAAHTPLAPLIFKFPQLLASDFLFSSTPFSTSRFLSSCSPACSSVLLSDSSHLCSSPLTAYPASKPTPDNFPPPDFSSYNRSFSVSEKCHQEPTLQPTSPYTPPASLALCLSRPFCPPPPFPLANNSLSPAYRPSNVLCSTLTDPPVFPVSLSLSLAVREKGAAVLACWCQALPLCFGFTSAPLTLLFLMGEWLVWTSFTHVILLVSVALLMRT